MGYHCSFTFFCWNADAEKLQRGLETLTFQEFDRHGVSLNNKVAAKFERDWPAAPQTTGQTYMLLPLGEPNMADAYRVYDDGWSSCVTTSLHYSPEWYSHPGLRWFGVSAEMQVTTGKECTAIEVTSGLKSVCELMRERIVERFLQTLLIHAKGILGYFSDDYSERVFDTAISITSTDRLFIASPQEPDSFVREARAKLILLRAGT